MDTVKFEIALARNPPRSSSTPPSSGAALVPNVAPGESPAKRCVLGRAGIIEDLRVPTAPTSPLSSSSPSLPLEGSRAPASTALPSSLSSAGKKESLGERFHHWMETDLEHGL